MPKNSWDAAKEVLRGKFTDRNTFIEKKERSQSNFTPQGTRKRTN